MPTYEYECEKCGRRFERFQTITAEPLRRCVYDGCGGRVHRVLSAGAGFLLKGSGFYATDYRSESYKKAEKAERGESKTTSSGNESSSSPKPSGTSSDSSSTASSGSSSSDSSQK